MSIPQPDAAALTRSDQRALALGRALLALPGFVAGAVRHPYRALVFLQLWVTGRLG